MNKNLLLIITLLMALFASSDLMAQCDCSSVLAQPPVDAGGGSYTVDFDICVGGADCATGTGGDTHLLNINITGANITNTSGDINFPSSIGVAGFAGGSAQWSDGDLIDPPLLDADVDNQFCFTTTLTLDSYPTDWSVSGLENSNCVANNTYPTECLVDAGTITNPTAASSVVLCAEDNDGDGFYDGIPIDVTGYVPSNGPDNCLMWAIWVADDPNGVTGIPTGPPPSGTFPLSDDPNFVSLITNVTGISVDFPHFVDGVTYYIAPVTMSDCGGVLVNPDCYEVGDYIEVYMNLPILTSITVDCDDVSGEQFAVISMTGGDAATNGTDFTITNNGDGTPDLTVVPDGDFIIVSPIPDNGNVDVTITDAAGCSVDVVLTNLLEADNCIPCNTTVGGVSATHNDADGNFIADGAGPFVVCSGDYIDFNNDGTFIPPPTGTLPGMVWGFYTDIPTSNIPTNDAAFTGIVWTGPTYEANNDGTSVVSILSDCPNFGVNIVDNTLYVAPFTATNAGAGGWAIDDDASPCVDVGQAYLVTFLNQISFISTQDCNGTNISLTGGYPEFFGGTFTIVNSGPGTLQNSTGVGDGGSFQITDLQDGDTWSIDVTDGNGCTTTLTGTYNYPIVDPVDVTFSGLGQEYCVGSAVGDQVANLTGSPTVPYTETVFGSYTAVVLLDGAPNQLSWSVENSFGTPVELGDFSAETPGSIVTLELGPYPPIGTGEYTFCFDDANGELFTCTGGGAVQGAGSITIVDNITGDVAFEDASTFSDPFCHTFAAPPQVNVTGAFSGPGSTDNGNATGTFDPFVAGVGSHDILYTVTFDGLCGVDSDLGVPQTVFVYPEPMLDPIDYVACDGNDVDIATLVTGSGIFNPTFPATIEVFNSTDCSGTAISGPQGTGNYSVGAYIPSAIDGSAYCPVCVTADITIANPPVIDAQTATEEICHDGVSDYDLTTFVPTGTDLAGGVWEYLDDDPAAGGMPLASTDLGPGNYTVWINYNIGPGCSDAEPYDFEIIATPPDATITPPAAPYCQGDAIDLVATEGTAGDPANLVWYPDDGSGTAPDTGAGALGTGANLDAVATSAVDNTVAATTVLWVIEESVSTSGGLTCSSTAASVSVVVQNCSCPTAIDLTPATDNLCSGDTPTLPDDATVTGNITVGEEVYAYDDGSGIQVDWFEDAAFTTPYAGGALSHSGAPANCAEEVITLYAAILCDADQMGDIDDTDMSGTSGDAGDYISMYVIEYTVYPDISALTLNILDDGTCAPYVDTWDCEGAAGYELSNDFDLNGANPDFSAASPTTGTFNFIITNTNAPDDPAADTCEFVEIEGNYDCPFCPTVNSVADGTIDFCSVDALTVGDLETSAALNTVLNYDAPSGTVVANVGLYLTAGDPPADPFTTASLSATDNCTHSETTVYAYVECDLTGDGVVDSYLDAGSIIVAVWPDMTALTAGTDYTIVNDNACCPSITIDCTGDDLVVSNLFDSNGANPDCSAVTGTGTIDFIITNNDAPASLSIGGTDCIETASITTNYDCAGCPTVDTPASGTFNFCIDDTTMDVSDPETNFGVIVNDASGVGYGFELYLTVSDPPADPYTPGSLVATDNCLQSSTEVFVYMTCDLLGDGFNGGPDDSYISAGSVIIDVYPDLSATTNTVNSDGGCLPSLTWECDGVAGYTIDNDLDPGTGAVPADDGGVASGSFDFTITNGNLPAELAGGVCESITANATYDCGGCAALDNPAGGIQIFCDSDNPDLSDGTTGLAFSGDFGGTTTVQYYISNANPPDPADLYIPGNIDATVDICNATTLEIFAFLECDLGDDGTIDQYLEAGSVMLEVYPDLSTSFTATVDNDGGCCPEVSAFDCLGAGIDLIDNDFQPGSGSAPDCSMESGTGTFNFQFCRTTVPAEIAGSACECVDVPVTYNCTACPQVTAASGTQYLCGDGVADLDPATTGLVINNTSGVPEIIAYYLTDGTSPTDEIVPDAHIFESLDACNSTVYDVYVYFLCDLEGDGFVDGGVDDSYVPAGVVTIEVFPDISGLTMTLIDDGLCGPSVDIYDCEGEDGFEIQNTYDANGGSPDFSSEDTAGGFDFTIVSTNAVDAGVDAVCTTSDPTPATYDCIPLVCAVLDGTQAVLDEVCSGDGIVIDDGGITDNSYPGGSISWYYDTVDSFDPYTEGTLIANGDALATNETCDPVTYYLIARLDDIAECQDVSAAIEVTVYPAPFTFTPTEGSCGVAATYEVTAVDASVCASDTGTAPSNPACDSGLTDDQSLTYSETFFAGSGCEQPFDETVAATCDAVACTACPSTTDAPGIEDVCSGTAATPIDPTLVDPNGNVVEWFVGDETGTPLAGVDWTNNTCDPITITLNAYILCDDDEDAGTPDIYQDLVYTYAVTIYPAPFTFTPTEGSCGVAATYEVTAVDASVCASDTGTAPSNPACDSGLTDDQSLAYSNVFFAGSACEQNFDETVVATCDAVACTACPSTTDVPGTEDVCSGTAATPVDPVLTDPNGNAVEWFVGDETGTPLAGVDWTNNTCDAVTITLNAFILCDDDEDGGTPDIYQDLLYAYVVTVYPAPFTFTGIPGSCGVAASYELTSEDGTICASDTGTAPSNPACDSGLTDDQSLNYSNTFFLGVVGCEQAFNQDVPALCAAVECTDCPSTTDAPGTEDVCSGTAATPVDPVLTDPNGNAVEWFVGDETGTPLAGVDWTNNTCDPITITLNAYILCDDDEDGGTPDIYQDLVYTYTVTVYPAPFTFTGTAGSCGVAASYEVTAVDASVCSSDTGTAPSNPACDSGLTDDQSLAYSNTFFIGSGCEQAFDETVAATCDAVACTACPSTTAAPGTEDVCSGTAATPVDPVLTDPNGNAVEWFVGDETGTPLAGVDWTNNTCDPITITLNAYILCDDDEDGGTPDIYQDLVYTYTVTVYPAPFTFTGTAGSCGVAASYEVTAVDASVCASDTGTAPSNPACDSGLTDDQSLAYSNTFFAGSGCEQTFDETVAATCEAVACTACPSTTAAPGTEDVCSGTAATPVDPVLTDPNGNAVEWFVGDETGTPLAGVDWTNNTCDPITITLSAWILCDEDEDAGTPDIYQDLVYTYTVTVYPAPFTFTSTAGSCGVAASYEVTAVDASVCASDTGTAPSNPACDSGLTDDQSLAYSNTFFAGSGCEQTFDETVAATCEAVVCTACPSTTAAPGIEDVCSGTAATPVDPVLTDPNGNAVEWFDGDANTGTPLAGVDWTNNTCDPITITLNAYILCDEDEDPGTPDIYQDLVYTYTVTVYPAPFTFTGTAGSCGVAASYEVTAVDASVCASDTGTAPSNPACDSGLTDDQSLAYSNTFFVGSGCEQAFDETVAATCDAVACTACPSTTAVPGTEDVCSGIAATPVDPALIDPNGNAVEWFDGDADTGTPLAGVDWTNNTCDPLTITLSAWILCDEDEDPGTPDIYQSLSYTYTVTVYPAPFTFTSTEGSCGVAASYEVTAVDASVCASETGTAPSNPACDSGLTDDQSLSYNNTFFVGSGCEQIFAETVAATCDAVACTACPSTTAAPGIEDVCSGTAATPVDPALVDPNGNAVEWFDGDADTGIPLAGIDWTNNTCDPITITLSAWILCDEDEDPGTPDIYQDLVYTYTVTVYPAPFTFTSTEGSCGVAASYEITAVDASVCASDTGTAPSNPACDSGITNDESLTYTNTFFIGSGCDQAFDETVLATCDAIPCTACPSTVDVPTSEAICSGGVATPIDPTLVSPNGNTVEWFQGDANGGGTPLAAVDFTNTGCDVLTITLTAWILCNDDEDPGTPDIYQDLFYTHTVTVYPDISGMTIDVSADECGPVVTAYDCEGTLGYSIANDLDGNGATPDYTALSDAASVTFDICNDNALLDGVGGDCLCVSVTAPYNCTEDPVCPAVLTPASGTQVFCSIDNTDTSEAALGLTYEAAVAPTTVEIGFYLTPGVTPITPYTVGTLAPFDPCESNSTEIFVYLECDLDGDGTIDEYTEAGSITVEVYPDLSGLGALVIDQGGCCPSVTAWDCEGVDGFEINNDYDDNGITPDCSAEASSGNIIFTIINTNVPTELEDSDCGSVDIAHTFNCTACPNVTTAIDETQIFCGIDGTVLNDPEFDSPAAPTEVTVAYYLTPSDPPADPFVPGSLTATDNCNFSSTPVYAYLLCDLDGDGFTDGPDDSYIAAGFITVEVYPDISTLDVTLNDDGGCCPSITFECEGIDGYEILNDYDENGSAPDCSEEVGNASIEFTITNTFAEDAGLDVECVSATTTTTNYNCGACPTTDTPAAGTQYFCLTDAADLSDATIGLTYTDPTGNGVNVAYFLDDTQTTPYTAGAITADLVCDPTTATIYVFLECDLNGDGFDGSDDDSYIAAGSIEVIVYPEVSATASPESCTASITVDGGCAYDVAWEVTASDGANLGTTGDGTSFNDGAQGENGTVEFTITNPDVNVPVACNEFTIAVDYVCPEFLCPSTLDTDVPEFICNGGVATLPALTLEDDNGEALEWYTNITDPAAPAGLYTAGDALIYAGDNCTPGTTILYAYIQCDTDGDGANDGLVSVGFSHSVTIYPDLVATEDPQGCVACVIEDCGFTVAYTVSSDGANDGATGDAVCFDIGEAGETGTVSFTITDADPDRPAACNDLVVDVEFACVACPTTDDADSQEFICEDDVATLPAVTLNNPNAEAIEWYTDVNDPTAPTGLYAAGDAIPYPAAGDGCASADVVLNAYIQCDSDGDGALDLLTNLNYTHTVTVYPTVSATAGPIACNATITVDGGCENYDVAWTVTATTNAANDGATGDGTAFSDGIEGEVGTIEFVVTNPDANAPAGCNSFTLTVDYDCPEFLCPTTLEADTPEFICDGDPATLPTLTLDNDNGAALEWYFDPADAATLYTAGDPVAYPAAGNGCSAENVLLFAMIQCDTDGDGVLDGLQSTGFTHTTTVYPAIVATADPQGCTAGVINDCGYDVTYVVSSNGANDGTADAGTNFTGEEGEAGTVTFTYTDTNADRPAACNGVTVDVAFDCGCTVLDPTFSYDSAIYCVSEGVITPNNVVTADGTFSIDGGLGIDAITGAIDLSLAIPGTTYTVTYLVGTAPCEYSDTYSFDVIGEPTVTIIGDDAVCQNGVISISSEVTAGAGAVYNWDFGGGSVVSGDVNGPGPIEVNYSTAGIASISLTVDENGCIGTAFQDISVNTVSASAPGPINIFIGTEASLDVVANTTGGGALTYEWSPADGLSCTDCANPIATPSETTTYSVIVTDEAACSEVSSVTVTVTSVLRVAFPNAFSPNNDGINDNFRPVSNVVESGELYIYDRWGKVMFSTNDPLNVSWDGTFKGELVDVGVYVFYARMVLIDGSEEVYKGNVTIVR